MILTVDIGNSRTKIDVWEGNEVIEEKIISFKSKTLRLFTSDINIINLLQNTENITAAVVSSVGGNPELLIQQIQKTTGGKVPVVHFDQKEIERYSDRITYEGNIGADRVAAWLGAEMLQPKRAKLIVDAGTAITLDVSDKEGKFMGGNISLGMTGRLAALNETTALLPRAKREYPDKTFGNHTLDALLCGVMNGVIGEIIYTVKRAKEMYGVESLWLTGGDAELIYRHLPLDELEGIEVRKEPRLVSLGLLFIGEEAANLLKDEVYERAG